MRKDPPLATKQLVLLEAGYMCANPRCRYILTLEIHHIVWVKDGGGNEPRNLLALCANCHSLHTKGHIPQQAIQAWKGMLLALNNTNRGSADILLHLYKQRQDPVGRRVWYSGDTLLHLAGLINAGLVETGAAVVSSWAGGIPPSSSFEVKLSDAGLQLVEAWLEGNEAQLHSALRQGKSVA